MHEIAISELARHLKGTIVSADPATRVRDPRVAASSTKVTVGAVFVAIRGNAADGHAFLDDAFARGAAIAVVEERSALMGRPGIVVENSRLALSSLAARFQGDPSQHLKVIGVTGTNGKTTTNWIIYHALTRIGVGALRIGTLGSEYMGRSTQEGVLTSPDPVSLHGVMAEARAAGAQACVMETSSHALHQARVEDVAFDVGVFTNLTRDHLDYHKTFEHYFAAKAHLFEVLARGGKPTKGAVINIDDAYGAQLWQRAKEMGLHDFSFGRDPRAAFRIVEVTETPHSMEIRLSLRDQGRERILHAPCIGPHNAENVVAAFAAIAALGYAHDSIIEALRDTAQVPGRLERVGQGSPRVFVDYAHTPDALERVLKAARVSTEGALWCVFGCGGDRDRGKRPEMGMIAAAHSDRVVVTSDNPRTEDPRAIIDDILTSGITPFYVEPDRAAAIRYAILEAASNDTVVIAGKGHENYQILGTTKVHFSDQEESLRALALRSHRSTDASERKR
jgi:UDP-N-acetylmuramoyl-L-alanyl-D-glutamate--2,6-diaminopimelate ligase